MKKRSHYPEYVYLVYLTDKTKQSWIPCYYSFERAESKVVNLIKELGYPEESIYSDETDDQVIYYINKSMIAGIPGEPDEEIAYINQYYIEDWDKD